MSLHPSDKTGQRRSSRRTHAAPRITIGAFAREFDVSLRTLRFYEDRGLLEPRREGSARFYGPDDRERLRAILRLKHLGFTLTEIRDMMIEGAQGRDPSLFQLRENQVQAQLEHLERQRQELDGAIAALKDVQRNSRIA